MKNKSEKVHLVEPEYGCSFYRKFAYCSDGTVVVGMGSTPKDAESRAKEEIKKREEYLKLPDIERLKILVQGNLLDADKVEAIRIIANILIRTTQESY